MRPRLLILLLLTLTILVHIFSLPSTSAVPILYQTTWGTTNNDYGQAVAQDRAGNTYVTGYTYGFTSGTPSIFLLKFSFTGVLTYQRLWSDGALDYAYGIALDKLGNIYVAGWTNNLGGPSLLLLKFNSLGVLSWQRTLGGSSFPSYGQGVATDSSGNIYVTGYYASSVSSDQNVSLVKFDPLGNLLWQRSWGGSSPEQARGVAVDPSGQVYVTGFTTSFGSGGADVFLLKFDSTGGLMGESTWGGSSDDKGNGIAVDSSANVYITGSTLSGSVVSNVFLLKYSSALTLLKQVSYAQPSATAGFGVAVNSTRGQVWITGTNTTGGYTKGLNLRYSSSSLALLNKTGWGSLNSGSDAGYAIAPDASGNVVITGVVSEAGPYKYTELNGAATTLSLGTMSPSVQPTDPGLITGFGGGSVTTPAGSTSYTSGTEVYLNKYGDLPSIYFTTSSSPAGLFVFAGTKFPAGSVGSYPYGTYTASVRPTIGYSFMRWNVTGALSVSSNYSNPTQVTVSGPGTVDAILAISIVNITVNLYPDSAGTVTCNNQTITSNQTLRVSVNTTYVCTANPYLRHRFISWSNINSLTTPDNTVDPSQNPVSFNVTMGGNFTAVFGAPLPVQPIPVLTATLPAVIAVLWARRLRRLTETGHLSSLPAVERGTSG